MSSKIEAKVDALFRLKVIGNRRENKTDLIKIQVAT
jgi:hypothetical protein